jgi:hypothetical protein
MSENPLLDTRFFEGVDLQLRILRRGTDHV